MSVEAAVILTAGALYLLTRDAPGKPSGVASAASKADTPAMLEASRGPIGTPDPAHDLVIPPGAFTPSADGTANRTAEMDPLYAERVPITDAADPLYAERPFSWRETLGEAGGYIATNRVNPGGPSVFGAVITGLQNRFRRFRTGVTREDA